MVKVKICCIQSLEEAKRAVSAGADAIGLVSEMPSGPGVIPEEAIKEICAGVPPFVSTFLLTCEVDPHSIARQQKITGANTLQLVGAISTQSMKQLKAELPGIKLVKVIHIEDGSAFEMARDYETYSNALLLDSGNTQETVPKLGGTGKVHDWTISHRIILNSSIPVILAGGIIGSCYVEIHGD